MRSKQHHQQRSIIQQRRLWYTHRKYLRRQPYKHNLIIQQLWLNNHRLNIHGQILWYKQCFCKQHWRNAIKLNHRICNRLSWIRMDKRITHHDRHYVTKLYHQPIEYQRKLSTSLDRYLGMNQRTTSILSQHDYKQLLLRQWNPHADPASLLFMNNTQDRRIV